MKIKLLIGSFVMSFSSLVFNASVYAGAQDDPLLTKVMIDQVEIDTGNENAVAWSAQAWVGYDLNKIWLKTQGERAEGETETAEVHALYSRAIAPFWDLQFGIRQDLKPSPSNEWAVIGLQGLAPYFFEIDTALFVGENAKTALRIEAEYELMLTQKWVLSPEIEANFYGQNDDVTGTGSGLSDIEAGLSLRYEIVREFAPYIGINWSKKFGNTADYAAEQGQEKSKTQLVLGFRAWF